MMSNTHLILKMIQQLSKYVTYTVSLIFKEPTIFVHNLLSFL